MTRPPSRIPPSRIEEEAAIWVARMDADDWSEAQEAELQGWLAMDPRHKGELLAAEAAEEPVPVAIVARPGRRAMIAGIGTALAASFAGGIFWIAGATTYSTEVGEIRRVPLRDGSTAAINTASKIRITLAARQRNVALDRGEAWFQVAKDPKRPFLVEAGRVRVEAVGTAFSVRRTAGGAEVLVTEGVVRAWVDGAGGEPLRLAAGQSATLSETATSRLDQPGVSGADRALAWRNGKIDLLGKTLREAVDEFNRYNHRQLILADPALQDEQLAGLFSTDDPESFAFTVKAALNIPIDTSNPDEIRIGAAKHD
jgi:transmembrane sensor